MVLHDGFADSCVERPFGHLTPFALGQGHRDGLADLNWEVRHVDGRQVVARERQRRILGGIEIDETAQAIRMLGAEGVQDIAATRVSDEDWLLHAEGADHLEDVVGPSLRIVSSPRSIRGADAAPGDGVDTKLSSQLRRDVIVGVPGELATNKQNRSSRSAPIQHFQSNGRFDRNEPHLVRRRITPSRSRLAGEQTESQHQQRRNARKQE